MTAPSRATSGTAVTARGTAASATITRPSGATDGRVAVVMLLIENGSGTPVTVTPPSDWVEVSGSPSTNPATGKQIHVHTYYKILGGSEPSSYAWSWSGSYWRTALFSTYQDVDTTTPINVGIASSNNTGTTASVPSRTTTADDVMLIAGYFHWQGVTLGSLSSPLSTVVVEGGNAYYMTDGVQTAAGASGAKTGTWSGSDVSIGLMFGLNGTGGGGATVRRYSLSLTGLG